MKRRLRNTRDLIVVLLQLTAFWANASFWASVRTFAADAPKDAANKKSESIPRFPAVEPADAEKTFKTRDGFSMKLIASEPLVTDPVAMVYDENGVAFVVEMNDYPYTNKATHQAWKDNTTDAPIGRVRILRDTNDDGVFDKSTIFAEGLSWPSGILCWKGGVFVTATPDVWYLKDTDGDDRADVRQQVFTGFRKYNVQAVMNNPIWGIDNKIYVAGSSNGGAIKSIAHPDAKVINLRGDFRIDPNTEQFELLAGGARFGNAFDDWGNRFLCNIRNPAIQVVLENRYLSRNTFLPVTSAIFNSAQEGDQLPVYRISPIEPWRDIRAKAFLREGNPKMPRSELTGGGVFTSTSGITIYRGDAYPPNYRGQAFVGEVANNVIYRQTVDRSGVAFTANRADENVEFVASTDTWFRPVNFVNAPDGTLHVLDMYRETIEHPWSIPDDIHAQVDLQSGSDRGRIYRLTPTGFQRPPSPRLGNATAVQLVGHLSDRRAWYRETSQRLLVERQDAAAVPALRQLITSDVNSADEGRTLGRLHALWTLAGLNALTESDLLAALRDSSPAVREHAVRLAESYFDSPAIRSRILEIVNDEAPRVRFQVAFSLGELSVEKEPRIVDSLLAIVRRDSGDRWIRTAVLSSPPDLVREIALRLLADEPSLTKLLEADAKAGAEPFDIIKQAMYVLGAQGKINAIEQAIIAVSSHKSLSPELSDAFWSGLGDGLRHSNKRLMSLFPDGNAPAAQALQQTLNAAALGVLSQDRSVAERRSAVRLLSYGSFETASSILPKLFDPVVPQDLQVASVRSLSAFPDPSVASLLVESWRNFTPTVREEVLNALSARRERWNVLLDSIESGKISPAQLGAVRRLQFVNSTDAKIKERAAKLFGQDGTPSRKEVVERYRVALTLSGDRQRGANVYEKNCASCHRLGNKGTDIGPNLETVKNWDSEKIMLNVLDPNREVAPSYLSYTILLRDGTVLNGIISDETASSITVKRSGAAPETILRQDIDEISGTGVSLMPVGIETVLQPQDISDVITFILAR